MSEARYQPLQIIDERSRRSLFSSENSDRKHPEVILRRTSGKRLDREETLRQRSDLKITASQRTEELKPFISLPTFQDPDYRFQLLQQWECVVRSIGETEFTAILYDLTDRKRAEEEATFLLDDVSDSDRAMVDKGAVFYWSIGYRTSSTNQKDRVSQIRFRRFPPWTRSERRDAEAIAEELRGLLSPTVDAGDESG